ncbi:nucleotidyltransferase-like protein [Paenibacillus tarimensis]
MDRIKAHFRSKYERHDNVISLAAIENPYRFNPLVDGLDVLMLLVVHRVDTDSMIEHMSLDSVSILIRMVEPERLEQMLACGSNREMIQWLVRGEVLLDELDYLGKIRQQLIDIPDWFRERKLLVEFSGFLSTYLQAKQDVQDGYLLDAHSNILSALHHWAHIALIEEDVHPELTVWRQMRRFNPGLYKLYEELISSPETLEQRVKLVLLGCEFSVMNKMKTCCALLFKVLMSREEPWSVTELHHHPELSGLSIDLSLLLKKLLNRGYIREVAVMSPQGDPAALELKYGPAGPIQNKAI